MPCSSCQHSRSWIQATASYLGRCLGQRAGVILPGSMRSRVASHSTCGLLAAVMWVSFMNLQINGRQQSGVSQDLCTFCYSIASGNLLAYFRDMQLSVLVDAGFNESKHMLANRRCSAPAAVSNRC